jgi:hypothetical protein
MPPDAGMQPVIDWFWTCAGKALGYRKADALFSCEGTQIGHFKGDEIYGREGNYLGEIGRNGRLITHLKKTRWRRSGFFPERGKHLEPPPDAIPENVEAGSKDFRIPRQINS